MRKGAVQKPNKNRSYLIFTDRNKMTHPPGIPFSTSQIRCGQNKSQFCAGLLVWSTKNSVVTSPGSLVNKKRLLMFGRSLGAEEHISVSPLEIACWRRAVAASIPNVGHLGLPSAACLRISTIDLLCDASERAQAEQDSITPNSSLPGRRHVRNTMT